MHIDEKVITRRIFPDSICHRSECYGSIDVSQYIQRWIISEAWDLANRAFLLNALMHPKTIDLRVTMHTLNSLFAALFFIYLKLFRSYSLYLFIFFQHYDDLKKNCANNYLCKYANENSLSLIVDSLADIHTMQLFVNWRSS